MKNSVIENEIISNEFNLIRFCKKLKKMAEDSNAAKVTVIAENSKCLNGWHIGITIQKPGFQPHEGDWRLNAD